MARVLADLAAALFARHKLYAPWQTCTVYEGVVVVGDRVRVTGIGARELDPDVADSAAGYREAPTRLRIGGTVDHLLVISNAGRG